MTHYSRPPAGFDRAWPAKFARSAVALAAGTLIAALAACATPHRQDPSAIPAPPSDSAPEVLPGAAPLPPPVAVYSAPALKPGAPLSYTVQRGDTLWSIANRFLLDPWQWPDIWYVNDQVRNPHLIYPGDVLRLSEVNGRAQLTLSGPDVERLSPQVRNLPLDDAIPTIPLDAIRDFLRGPRLITTEELQTAPYLLSFVDAHLIGGEGNLIYVRRLPQQQAWSYALVRKGQAYRDPDDGKLLGYEAVPVGAVDIKEPGDPATGLLVETQREALVGDHLLPIDPSAFRADFYPHAPAQPVGGRIIAAFDGLSQISQYQIIAINRGSQHGLEPGHVLQILQSGDRVRDPYTGDRVKVPDQPAGNVLVFKVTPKLSYALVMSVTRPAHLLDKVEKPRPTR